MTFENNIDLTIEEERVPAILLQDSVRHHELINEGAQDAA